MPDTTYEPVDYCREIETFLCQKNDGHLIRVVGPSFEIVSGWSAQGIPLKVVFAGIDRYFERYYRKGPRRRPIKIDFCEADVLDAFDEWRRALGLTAADTPVAPAEEVASRSSSLPAHLERVVTRLTTARATGKIDATFDALIDRDRTRAGRGPGVGARCARRRTTGASGAAGGARRRDAADGSIQDRRGVARRALERGRHRAGDVSRSHGARRPRTGARDGIRSLAARAFRPADRDVSITPRGVGTSVIWSSGYLVVDSFGRIDR